ncbi:MAG: lipid-A-disaccharide synthase [Candidatus Poribacteria bacterium]|nr:lipid-A-disaccharide synthase [Candidatus Poribacteria bacterium]
MARPLTLLISAGEPSGDLHAGALSSAIRRRLPDARLGGMGGPKMKAAGVELLIDIESSSVMGLVEVLRQVPEFLKKRDRLRDWIFEHRPDAVILVDFPDFNLRLAKKIRALGIPLIYLIPPKAWAWRRNRASKVADWCATVISILPFEAAFYQKYGATVDYVGHPLVDIIHEAQPPSKEEARTRYGVPLGAPVVGLLPGSRRREVASLLMPMLGAAERLRETLPELRVVVPLASSVTDEMLAEAKASPMYADAILVRDDTYGAIRSCDAVIAASGTVTLEAAILGVPMVIVYKLAALTYALARPFIRVRHSGLPNLLAANDIAPELYQEDVSPERIAQEVLPLLTDPDVWKTQRDALAFVTEMLGEGGAVEKAADAVLRVAQRNAP